ncbi:MAG: tetratricopeptide repeat protein [Gemmataceae bacterium]
MTWRWSFFLCGLAWVGLTGCAGKSFHAPWRHKSPSESVATPPTTPKEEGPKADNNSIKLTSAKDWLQSRSTSATPAPADSLVLRAGGFEEERPPVEGELGEKFMEAMELYRREEYKKAESIFHNLAGKKKKHPPELVERAIFYEAECLYRQGRYPRAADTYSRLLNDFPSGAYREQAVQRLYDIANYWLDDTRVEMEEYREKLAGKRWLVWPRWFHWHKSKPWVDAEGRALKKLEEVHYNDMSGPYSDKAMFLAGSVMFYRENYQEADHYFSQLIERMPNSQLAPQALELAIISKHMSAGGTDYDGRKVAEARHLVDSALRNYPELANEKRDFLENQLVGINLQQAEKDFRIAEFYRRTGHPASAYFYYEIVRRRYPGTPFFDQATERMHELRRKEELALQQKAGSPDKPAAPAAKPEIAPPPRRLEQGLEIAPPPRRLPE